MTTENTLGLPVRPFKNQHLNELLGAYRASYQLGHIRECDSTYDAIVDECATEEEKSIAREYIKKVRDNE